MQSVDVKGFSIPIVGLGTWELRGRDCARLTEQAIKLGYRHIDSAQLYANEAEVGGGWRPPGLRQGATGPPQAGARPRRRLLRGARRPR